MKTRTRQDFKKRGTEKLKPGSQCQSYAFRISNSLVRGRKEYNSLLFRNQNAGIARVTVGRLGK
ncbi:hypothetical protein E2C01_018799 [Portunus trituberculatus]|uniref:Uncharacterized protein n=1 Tax=Portunus trituberculatus TaxID=210409 RepID=A0A5B7DXC6_PORTR|nr:hypothetical protein [Portunus trituberculatus]